MRHSNHGDLRIVHVGWFSDNRYRFRGFKKMGLAPNGNRKKPGKFVVAKVRVTILAIRVHTAPWSYFGVL